MPISQQHQLFAGHTARAGPWRCFLWLGLLLAQASFGQSETVDDAAAATDPAYQSGYAAVPEFGGPESVGTRLKENDQEREFVYQFDGLQRALGPYYDWKRRAFKDRGLATGTSLYLLYQNASDSLGADDDALGSIFRYQGSWTLFTRENGNLGRIEWRAESRFNLGGFQAPGQLGGAIGTAALAPGFAYSENFDLDVPVLSYAQSFNDGRAGFALGRVAFDVFLDAFPFQTLSKGFINRSFILNPTLPTTGTGALGGAVRGFVSERLWLGAQFHDANAASGEFDFDTVQEGEWIKAVEIGYTPSFAQRKTQLVQLTYWEKDARDLAGTSKGKGWAVSAAYPLNEHIFPFVRFGHSNGGGGVAAEDAISAGVQITRRRGMGSTLRAAVWFGGRQRNSAGDIL
jgi:porin